MQNTMEGWYEPIVKKEIELFKNINWDNLN
jgi:hypothetical protein